MSALTGPRRTALLAGGGYMNVGVIAAAVCYQGGMAMAVAANGGAVRPARAGQGGNDAAKSADVVGCRVLGIFDASVTGSGTDGDVRVDVLFGPQQLANSSAGDQITEADIGFECYVVDDQTVAKTSNGGTRPVAGVVARVETDGVFVDFDRSAASKRRKIRLYFAINETDTLAGTSAELIAPEGGYVSGMSVIVQKTVTTGGPVTAKVGATDVVGLSCVIADGAAKGTIVSDTPTAGDASTFVAAGTRVQVVPDAAFTTAGAISGFVEITVPN